MGKLKSNKKPKHKKDWFNRDSEVDKLFTKKKKPNDKNNL